MRQLITLTAFVFLLSCKRNHTQVLIKTIDNDTGLPAKNVKFSVYRKGKKGLFTDKESVVVSDGYTDFSGEALVRFKYDRGNKYAAIVYGSGEYWVGNTEEYDDLYAGKNESVYYVRQLCYLKINLKSSAPNGKILDLRLDNNKEVFYQYFYNHSPPLDTIVFLKAAYPMGIRTLDCIIDSAGNKKNNSFSIQLKGHDTTYCTVNF